MPHVDDLDIQISASAEQAEQALDSLINKLDQVYKSFSKSFGSKTKTNTIANTSSNATNKLDKYASSANKAAKENKSLASTFGTLYANFFWVIRGIKALNSSIESTADYMESFNYFEVSFGKIADQWSKDFEKHGYDNAESYAESFTDRMNETFSKLSGVQFNEDTGLLSETGLKNLGLNIQEITNYASQLASVSNSIGTTGEVSVRVASLFTKLAGDISSLFNVDYSSVSKNLQSGLIGQSRALYKYGIDITNATLQTYAYELGLEKAVSEMTQAEKMQLRVLAILDQSRVSWGDLANTINSPSNMLRQFTNNMKEAGMMLGQLFIPLLEKVMPVLNGMSIAIKRLLGDIAGFFGVELNTDAFGQGFTDAGEDLEDVADGYDAATKAAKKYQNQILGFDEINKLSAPTDSDKGTGAVGGSSIDLTEEIKKATEEYEKAWGDAYEKMQNKAKEYSEILVNVLKRALPYVAGIGIGFAGWKVGTGLLKVIDLFKTGAFSGWGIVIAAIAGRFLDLYTNSENFREGISRITEVFGGIWTVLSETIGGIAIAVWDVSNAFLSWLGFDFSWIVEAIELLDLDFGDLAMTIAGFALLGTPFGPVLLAVEGISIAVRALGGINEETWEKIKTKVGDAWEFIKKTFSNSWNNVVSFFTTALPNWWDNTIMPWFTKERWIQLWQNVKSAFVQGWQNVVTWWKNSAIVRFWNESVKPFFSKDKWTFSGIKDGISAGFNAAVEGAKNIWNNFANWLNGKLTWSIPPVKVMGKTIFDGTTISLGRVPTFAVGGFPEDGLFMANHNELVGKFSNGRTAVANNQQITDGIRDAVVSGMMEVFMATSGSNNENGPVIEAVIKVDSETVYRLSQKGKKKHDDRYQVAYSF